MTTTVQVPPAGSSGTPTPAPPPARGPTLPYRMPQPKYRRSTQISRTHKIAAYTLLVLGSIAFLVPFYFVVNASLKTDTAVQSGDFRSHPASVEQMPVRNHPG